MNSPAATPSTASPPPNTIVATHRPYGTGTSGIAATDSEVTSSAPATTGSTPYLFVAQPAGPSITSAITAWLPSIKPTADGSRPPGPEAYSGSASCATLSRNKKVARCGSSTSAITNTADQPRRSRGRVGPAWSVEPRLASGSASPMASTPAATQNSSAARQSYCTASGPPTAGPIAPPRLSAD